MAKPPSRWKPIRFAAFEGFRERGKNKRWPIENSRRGFIGIFAGAAINSVRHIMHSIGLTSRKYRDVSHVKTRMEGDGRAGRATNEIPPIGRLFTTRGACLPSPFRVAGHFHIMVFLPAPLGNSLGNVRSSDIFLRSRKLEDPAGRVGPPRRCSKSNLRAEPRGSIVWRQNKRTDRELFHGVIRAVGTLFRGLGSGGIVSRGKRARNRNCGTPPWVTVARGQHQESLLELSQP